MKLCIPSMGAKGLKEQVGEHFGRVPNYTIVDTESNEVTVKPNRSAHMGGQGYPAEILSRMGINTMLCGGLGQRAVRMFEEAGVMVYIGAKGKVQDAVRAFKENRLEAATDENACASHTFRGNGIGEKHGHKHKHDHGHGAG